MPRFALDLELTGGHYAGTAIQPGVPTVQGHLEEILARLAGRPVRIRLAGRLDRGVAAEGLPIHVDLERDWDPCELARALTGQAQGLPGGPALVVRRAARVADHWDALFTACEKRYRYVLVERSNRPILEPRCWWLRGARLDSAFLDAGAALFVGRHDLSGFACLRGDPSDRRDGTRTITASHWLHESIPGGVRRTFRICAQGFLYKQVRGLVGALVQGARLTGTGPSLDDLRAAIAAGRQAPRLGDVAPASGLTLESVSYGAQEPAWTWA